MIKIGTMVQYRINEGPEVFPALVTKVHTETLVNLTVFKDSGTGLHLVRNAEKGDGKEEWTELSDKAAKVAKTEKPKTVRKTVGGKK